ncbi:MAG: sigma-70 family RNA polymerase sigma factor [Mariprofundales bacterium]|nr:sigma-70 family RNA polymerase sigma factor [Mariprofundales bacterium]
MMDDSPQRWLQEHGDALYGYAMRQIRDGDMAADLVQETLLAGWRNRQTFAGRSRERTWLMGILRHKIVDKIRALMRERAFTQGAEDDPTDPWFAPNGAWLEAPSAWRYEPTAELERRGLAQQIEECIQKLPLRSRLVFQAREIAGEESEEICKRFELTATNFHVVMHRARLALRRCLERHGIGSD